MPRAILACSLAAGTLVLAACGRDGAGGPTGPPVRVSVASPSDQATIRAPDVELRGHVSPRVARVLVRGTRALVRNGAFATRVALEPGVNVIDVIATAPAARPAITAIRVRRQVVVTVPDLAGVAPDDAEDRLHDLGLAARRENAGGLFDDLVPDDPVVCATDPASGERADVGSTVTLLTARLC